MGIWSSWAASPSTCRTQSQATSCRCTFRSARRACGGPRTSCRCSARASDSEGRCLFRLYSTWFQCAHTFCCAGGVLALHRGV
eukprot:UN4279